MVKGFQEDFGFVAVMRVTGVNVQKHMIVGFSSGFCEDTICELIEFYECQEETVWPMCLKGVLYGEARIGVIFEEM